MKDLGKLEFRPAEPGDERAILELYRLCYGQPLQEEVWRWRFRNCPAGQGIIELAWDSETLVAHYAVTPVDLSMAGQEFKAGLSGTTMTHPGYRGLGLFPELACRTYERMKACGMGVVFGFPNARSHRGFIKDLGWTDIYEVPTFTLDLDQQVLPSEVSSDVEMLDGFDERFDTHWERARERPELMGRRDRATLSWRYTDNPLTAYRILGYVQAGELSGYSVFKDYKGRIQVVDLCALEVEVEHELVKAVLQIAHGSSSPAVDMWLSVHRPLHRLIERYGFTNSSPVTYLGALCLGMQPTPEVVGNWRNWHLTMGDSDVY